MTLLSAKLGFWASLASAVLFLVFTVCFIAIAAVNPLFSWTNLADYIAYTEKYNQVWKYIAQSAMLFFTALYIIMLDSLYDFTNADKKPLVRIALVFGAIFAALVSLHYFVQLSSVRLNLAKGHLEGIEQFLQSRPDSAISAINMLGWSLFFGLSSLFVAPVFGDSRLERWIRRLFFLNGAVCLLAGIAFVIDNIALVFLTINFGMGGAVIAITILMTLFFRRKMRLVWS